MKAGEDDKTAPATCRLRLNLGQCVNAQHKVAADSPGTIPDALLETTQTSPFFLEGGGGNWALVMISDTHLQQLPAEEEQGSFVLCSTKQKPNHITVTNSRVTCCCR